MPILITAAAASAIFSSLSSADPGQPSFLDPGMLQNKIESVLWQSERLDQALKLVEELDRLAQAYTHSADRSLEEYRGHVARPGWSAESIKKMLAPYDQIRTQTLNDLLRIRQSMLDLLTEEEWHRIFE
jgi:hypothetical protein